MHLSHQRLGHFLSPPCAPCSRRAGGNRAEPPGTAAIVARRLEGNKGRKRCTQVIGMDGRLPGSNRSPVLAAPRAWVSTIPNTGVPLAHIRFGGGVGDSRRL